MAKQDTCAFCHEKVYERQSGVTVITGSDWMDQLSMMTKRKFVCPSCSAVFCLECGNKKGKQLKTGATHCPKCGIRVL